MKGVTIGLAVAAMIAASTGVASADQADYLAKIQENYPLVYSQHGPQALVQEGLKVCKLEGQGMGGMDVASTVQRDLAMSYGAAAYIVMIVGSLGC
jgi:hypothetical protein